MLTNWRAYAVAAIVFVVLMAVYNRSDSFRKLLAKSTS